MGRAVRVSGWAGRSALGACYGGTGFEATFSSTTNVLSGQLVRVGNRIAGTEAARAHPAQPVAQQVFGLLQAQPMHRLQDQHPNLQDRVGPGTAALRRITPGTRSVQFDAEDLEIHRRGGLLQRIALRRQLPKLIFEVPELKLTSHPPPPLPLGTSESSHGSKLRFPEVFRFQHNGKDRNAMIRVI